MENIDKIVEFEKYCLSCEFIDHNDAEDPCHDCLNHPTNVNSHKPVRYQKAEKKDKKKK